MKSHKTNCAINVVKGLRADLSTILLLDGRIVANYYKRDLGCIGTVIALVATFSYIFAIVGGSTRLFTSYELEQGCTLQKN